MEEGRRRECGQVERRDGRGKILCRRERPWLIKIGQGGSGMSRARVGSLENVVSCLYMRWITALSESTLTLTYYSCRKKEPSQCVEATRYQLTLGDDSGRADTEMDCPRVLVGEMGLNNNDMSLNRILQLATKQIILSTFQSMKTSVLRGRRSDNITCRIGLIEQLAP